MSKEKGYVLIYRDIKEHWLWDDKPFSKGQAFIDLVLRASHKDTEFLYSSQICNVKRGQFTTSIVKLADEWGWSRWKVKNFLLLLEEQQMIAHQTDSKKTAVTIRNYELYQTFEKGSPTSNRQSTDSQPTSSQHQTDTINTQEYITNTQKVKKGAPPGAKPKDRYSGGFTDF